MGETNKYQTDSTMLSLETAREEIVLKMVKELHEAASIGIDKKITEIIEQNTNIINNALYKNGCSALGTACRSGQALSVALLLEKGADIENRDEFGYTPLHLSCELGHTAIARLLLNKGANIETMTTDGYTPLHTVCESGNLSLSILLLDRGANIDAQTLDGSTPLHGASAKGHDTIVNLLLSMEADIAIQNNYGSNALHKAATNSKPSTVGLLLEHGADIEGTCKDGSTALVLASSNGREHTVGLLLDRGANIDAQTLSGRTALHQACANGHINIAKLLLARGANIQLSTKPGSTALHLASESSRDDIVALLIENGANIEAETLDGMTALHRASTYASDAVVESLIERGACLEAHTQDWDTPLHLACAYGKASTVRLLLNHNAQHSSQNKMGDTPLHIACRHGRLGAVKLLLQKSASITATNKDGATSLHLASFSGYLKVISVLLAAGSDINSSDKYGDPGLHPKPRVFESPHPYPNHITEYTPVEIPGAHSYTITFDPRSSTEPFHYGDGDYIIFYKDRSYREFWGSGHYSGGLNGTPKHFPGVESTPPLQISKNKFIFCFFTEGGVNDWGYRMTATPNFLLSGDAESSESVNGWTPLMRASYNGQTDAVKLLIDAGAALESRGWDGSTALSLAIQNFHKEAALLLVMAGARLDTLNQARISPIEMAVHNTFHSFISSMLKESDPFDHPDKVTFKPGAIFVWQYILSSTESYLDEVCDILDRFSSRLLALANAVDESGRRTIDVARPIYKNKIMERLYFFKRYELKDGPPEHKSDTCIVRIATDHGTTEKKEVALKFMKIRDQFHRETAVRSEGNFDDKFVMTIIRSHDFENDEEFNAEVTRKGLTPYGYCIVMPAAERSLGSILTHEHIAGRDWDKIKLISSELVKAVEHMHDKRMIHGDIKALNVLRSDGRHKLADFDAVVNMDTPGAYAGAKYSSAFIPPELLVMVNGKVKVRTYRTDSQTGAPVTTGLDYELLKVHYSFDMWSLGVLFYQLFTGEPLFKANDEDNIDQENMRRLFLWTEEHKNEILSKVLDPSGRNLLARLLSKDPAKRPDASRVLAHPFFSGQHTARMIGEEAHFDVFISYRVASDSRLAEAMYDKLTLMGLRVYWDKRCLEAGKRWEENFLDGIISSAVFVPLISKEGMNNDNIPRQNFFKLTEDSACDNVLLEHRLALELVDMGLVEAVYPIFVGDTKDKGDYHQCTYTRFKRWTNLPDVAIKSIEEKIRVYLDAQGLGAPLTEKMTVKEINTKINCFQGGYLEGEGVKSFEDLCAVIEETVIKQRVDKQTTSKSRAETDILKDEIERLKSDNAAKESDITALRNQLKSVSDSNHNLTIEIERLRKEHLVLVQGIYKLTYLIADDVASLPPDTTHASPSHATPSNVVRRPSIRNQRGRLFVRSPSNLIHPVDNADDSSELATMSAPLLCNPAGIDGKGEPHIKTVLKRLVQELIDTRIKIFDIRTVDVDDETSSLSISSQASFKHPIDRMDSNLHQNMSVIGGVGYQNSSPVGRGQVVQTFSGQQQFAAYNIQYDASSSGVNTSRHPSLNEGPSSDRHHTQHSIMVRQRNRHLYGHATNSRILSITRTSQRLAHTVSISGDPPRQGAMLLLDSISSILLWKGIVVEASVGGRRGSAGSNNPYVGNTNMRAEKWCQLQLTKDMTAVVSGGEGDEIPSIDVLIAPAEKLTIRCFDPHQRESWLHVLRERLQSLSEASSPFTL